MKDEFDNTITFMTIVLTLYNALILKRFYSIFNPHLTVTRNRISVVRRSSVLSNTQKYHT